MADLTRDDRLRRQIAQRLSLRRPQEEALRILGDVVGMMEWDTPVDVGALLGTVQAAYPSVESFERAFPVHYVEHMSANLNDLWRSRGLLPADVILKPPAGYELAAAKIAQHLLGIATSNGFGEWIGATAAIPVLQTAAAGALRHVPRIAAVQLTNDAIIAFNDVNDSLAKLRRAASDDDCLSYARAFQAADKKYAAAIARSRASE